MAISGITLQYVTFDIIRAAFLESFGGPRSSLDNLTCKPSNQHGTFHVLKSLENWADTLATGPKKRRLDNKRGLRPSRMCSEFMTKCLTPGSPDVSREEIG